MADKNILEQMLGHLVNDDKQKAEELFHEYVVAKSREIYEQLIEAEMDDEKMKDDFDLATVREYVEKVPAGHGAEKKGAGEKADGSATGLKFQKNDMGGTSANILGGKNGSDAGMQGMSGDLKGSSLLKGKPQLQDGGNVNTPGAKNGNAFSTKEPGHGAEKAGSKESADKGAAGLFRGRR